ncbi:hypothetical protein [Paenibacillus daejeonensis]|uniref:hypothetical protein n=1 Tax=Paenibacillus daejeonensis TaxID=135193 RepID=UPI00037EBBAF|nr:hypothetical protein [Paenibacillus daejeonensis]
MKCPQCSNTEIQSTDKFCKVCGLKFGEPLTCIGCDKHPDEIEEYIEAAELNDMTPVEYVLEEEGTYNGFEPERFYCTECYIKAGMPLNGGQE